MHQLVMGSLILMFVTLGWGTSSVGQEVLVPGAAAELTLEDRD
jgi:hypothetical protein